MKRSTNKRIEPAAAPTMTPIINPRELAIEPLWAGTGVEALVDVLEDGEVASGDVEDADDTDDDIDVEGVEEVVVSVGWELVVGTAEGIAAEAPIPEGK
jgi:hypothetical protein